MTGGTKRNQNLPSEFPPWVTSAIPRRCKDCADRVWSRLCASVVQFLRNQKNVDEDVIDMVRSIRVSQAAWCIPQCIVATIIFLYCMSLVFWFASPRIFTIAPKPPSGETRLPHFIEPVIMTIATNGMSVSKLVTTAREQGEFQGDFYVLTNDPRDQVGGDCTAMEHPRLATYLTLDLVEDGNQNMKDESRQASKHLKQELFSILDGAGDVFAHSSPDGVAAGGGVKKLAGLSPLKPPREVQRVLYLDADVDVNHPLKPFFAAVASSASPHPRRHRSKHASSRASATGEDYPHPQGDEGTSTDHILGAGGWDPECSVYMFRERSYTKSPFNGGTMLLDRTFSKDFLAAWKNTLQIHPEFPRDQLALSLTLIHDIHNRFKVCELPSPGGLTYGSDLLSYVRGLRSTTFTHWGSWKGLRGRGLGGWIANKGGPESLCKHKRT